MPHDEGMTKSRVRIDSATVAKMRGRLEMLYSNGAETCLESILRLVEQHAPTLTCDARGGWDERDVVLITYGDQIRAEGESPLATLREFLTEHGLDQHIRTVHLLPFYPCSSGDGFSVIDYRAVDPLLGGWDDIRNLGQRFDLMFDQVLNHVSSRSHWFQEYLGGRQPYVGYFIEADLWSDLSRVTRPRSLPLLSAVETSRGTRHVWTTFSADQVDLNSANPDVPIEMIDIFLFYIQQGARIIRLDAVAYLWKQVGTNCIHLPRTHEVVKLLRDLVEAVAPHVFLLAETNVPHAENVSYVSALGEPNGINSESHAQRFLSSQGLMLSLRGMPAIYFHSLVGTTNDRDGVERSGQPRRINRRKFRLEQLTTQLSDADSLQARIFAGYRHLLSVRIRQPAFHPDAQQEVWQFAEPWLVAILRTSIDQKQQILVLANVSDQQQQLDLSRFTELRFGRNLLTGRPIDSTQCVSLNAFLETVYYRKPIFCNRYTIFRTDIEPCGLQAIVMDGFLTDDVVNQVRRVLTDREYREAMVDNDYHAARKYDAYERMEQELRSILDRPRPCGPPACRRIQKV